MDAPWQKLGFKLKLGLRSRPEADWLPVDDLFGNRSERDSQIRQKADLLANHHSDVFAALPSANLASTELLDMICDHLSTYHKAPPRSVDPQQHPLEAAARLVPEDLLLLAPKPRPGQDINAAPEWHLVAAALAFPAHWILAEKMGKPLDIIHQPVPHYDERLASPVDRFFNAMKIGPISSRLNWSLQLGDHLFAPRRSSRPGATAATDISHLFLRIEHQTLRKLPKTGYVVFTIRTHMLAMTLWQSDREALQSMLDMMQEMSPATQSYKGVPLYEPVIRAALDRLGTS